MKQSKLFIEKPLIDGYDERSVVYEIMTKEGFDLNAKIEHEKGDLKPWIVVDADKRIIVTFADNVAQDQVEKMKLSADDVFVCFDSALDDTAKVNLGRGINIKTI
jgi:adenine-specific DNA-methyltransferase